MELVDHAKLPLQHLTRLFRPSLLIFLTGLVLRLAWLARVYGSRDYYRLELPVIDLKKTSDAGEYVSLGRSLRFDHVFALEGTPTYFRAPGYPAFIASLWWGESPILLLLCAQCVLGAATAVLAYKIARNLDKRIALLAGLGMAFAPLSIAATAEVLTETLFTFLVTTFVYFWLRKRFVLAGLILGLSWLVRPTTMPFIGFILLAVFLFPRLKSFRSGGVVIAAIAILTVAPWVIRNALVFRKFVPVAIGGGRTNLLSGTFNISYGRDIWEQWQAEPAIKTPYSWYDPRTEELFLKRAVERISRDPIGWLRTRIKQYPRLLLDTGAYLYPSRLVKAVFIVGSAIFVGIGSLGILRYFFQYPELVLFPAFILIFHLPLWVEIRYSLPMQPMMLILMLLTLFNCPELRRRACGRPITS